MRRPARLTVLFTPKVILRVFLLFAGISGVTLPASAVQAGAAIIDAHPQVAPPLATSEQFVRVGEVVARTDRDFTLLDADSKLYKVAINPETVIRKGAASIKLSELVIGDHVKVTLMQGGDGALYASEVLVRAPTE